MKRLMFLPVILALTSCAALDSFKGKAADFNDESLLSAEFTICKAASIGSVMRRYGGSEEKAKAWKELCKVSNDAAPTILEP